MKLFLATVVGGLLLTGVAFAQSPTNSTVEGSQAAPSQSEGMPSAAAPTGQVAGNSAGGLQTPQTPGDKAAGQPTTENSTNSVATAPAK